MCVSTVQGQPVKGREGFYYAKAPHCEGAQNIRKRGHPTLQGCPLKHSDSIKTEFSKRLNYSLNYVICKTKLMWSPL